MSEIESSSPHRLVAFLNGVSRSQDSASAMRAAAELVSEEFDAEVGAVVVGDSVGAAVGFGQRRAPELALVSIRAGTGMVLLEGVGTCHSLAAAWNVGTCGRLVVARMDAAFDIEDRNLMLGMARALGLALDMVAVLERERGRQRVLEVLLEIQRAISHRAPLSEILTAVTDGAKSVMAGCPVSLILNDALDPDWPIITGADLSPTQSTISAPVHVHGVPAGELLAAARGGERDRTAQGDLLRAFAEHASIALTDARTVEAMQEAFRDPLTGLPNRRLFLDRLAQSLQRRDPGTCRMSVLFIDLDRFKAVNDSLGHAAGDELLRSVAGRIQACTRAEDIAARFGGDEFALALQDHDPPARALRVAERIVSALREPFTIHGKVVFIGATIGIAHTDSDGDDADWLLGNADLAMYQAKGDGGEHVRVYNPVMRSTLVERLELEVELQHALPRRELELYYQPIIELDSGRIRAFEALLRWRHPTKGLILPTAFIPLAEATGLIVDIGGWVIQEACRQLATWRVDDPALSMHVNVSAHQLRDRTLLPLVTAALADLDLPGQALTLEITETSLIRNNETTLTRLLALKRLNVSVALDDFGTGYSSLSYLQRFPVDTLKIDRSFVSGEASGTRGDQLISMIIQLGRAFGLDTIAEGIENADQCERLRRMGCRTAQGFYFARPMDARNATMHLTQRLDRRTPA